MVGVQFFVLVWLVALESTYGKVCGRSKIKTFIDWHSRAAVKYINDELIRDFTFAPATKV